MIGKCWFELIKQNYATGRDIVKGNIIPDMDYNLVMVEYDAPPPTAKTYRVDIEGRDGTLDLSEWEGYQQVRYNDRQVLIKLRDMNGVENANNFIGRMLGNIFNIHFNDDSEYYFRGRCESVETSTRQHVTDISMVFTCHPFRYSISTSKRDYTIPAREFINDTIVITGRNVNPIVVASGVESGLSYNSTFNILRNAVEIYNITNDGEVNTSGAVFRTGNTNISIVNANTDNDLHVSISWRQEVI